MYKILGLTPYKLKYIYEYWALKFVTVWYVKCWKKVDWQSDIVMYVCVYVCCEWQELLQHVKVKIYEDTGNAFITIRARPIHQHGWY